MSKWPPPDPVAVLDATELLLRMIISSSWLHIAAHGIISITAAVENRVISQGRDGAIKLWGSKIDTNSYQFCI
ncbi:hypothetical protein SASPL_148824 [Salvia splendens]|uniref:Uncharacterized protein n=1 Tax=Salvia splendens TaxID=180675 RepID=A0A8X8Z432_SALSN|nr:hypothetical protein SASPL_148824 [Salvia splendens]